MNDFQEKPTSVILIACYCFLLAAFCLSLAINSILNNLSVFDSGVLVYLPIVSFFIMMLAIAAVGVGILFLNSWCWKILFFALAISMSSVATMLLVSLFLIFCPLDIIGSCLNILSITPIKLISFLFFFLSEIIVLYYLTRIEVLEHFYGLQDEWVKPF
ncbi:MAG: hypothetical protein HQL15_04665 [Candidatus Omnitrophica bacterium]|nr:hypothetical protein [Candidatus Omnitrophota bacterium]